MYPNVFCDVYPSVRTNCPRSYWYPAWTTNFKTRKNVGNIYKPSVDIHELLQFSSIYSSSFFQVLPCEHFVAASMLWSVKLLSYVTFKARKNWLPILFVTVDAKWLIKVYHQARRLSQFWCRPFLLLLVNGSDQLWVPLNWLLTVLMSLLRQGSEKRQTMFPSLPPESNFHFKSQNI